MTDLAVTHTPPAPDQPMLDLILATRNRHKVAEIRALLGDACVCHSLNDFPAAPDLVEDADSFAGNATRKALQLAAWIAPQAEGKPAWVLADDSGLEVDALHGEPGVRSARFAAVEGSPGNATDEANNAKLLQLLAGIPLAQRTARFRCSIALTRVGTSDSSTAAPRLFEGVCEGVIGLEPRGRHGFGYDPLFLPSGWERTFAELTDVEKNRISHRHRALAQLRKWLKDFGQVMNSAAGL